MLYDQDQAITCYTHHHRKRENAQNWTLTLKPPLEQLQFPPDLH